MSRLADALRRAEGHDPAADLIQEADHTRGELWGIDRPEAIVALDNAQAITSTRSPARERDDAVERHLTGLVDRVFLPISGEPARFVAFASTGMEADSGLLTATAAEMLAERTTRNVCVIDANFRMPSLHEHFGVPNDDGLAEALASDTPLAESARRLQHNLWLLPAGLAADRPSFASPAVRQRLTQFLAKFDFVLVAGEPAIGGSNVGGLLRLIGNVIIVVAADSTRRETARRATQTLVESGVTVIGAVLTNRRFPIPDALYRML